MSSKMNKQSKQIVEDSDEYENDTEELTTQDSEEEQTVKISDKSSVKSNSSKSSKNSKNTKQSKNTKAKIAKKVESSDSDETDSESDVPPVKPSKKQEESESDEELTTATLDETEDNEQEQKKEQPKEEKKEKQKKQTTPQNDKISGEEWEEMKQNVKVPSKETFYKSPVMVAIKWMLDNIHKDVNEKGLTKRNPATKTETKVQNFTSKDFNGKFATTYYEAFIKSYRIKEALRTYYAENNAEDNVIKFANDSKTKQLKMICAKGKNKCTFISLSNYPQDIEDIKAFDKLTKDIYYNINYNKLNVEKTQAGTNSKGKPVNVDNYDKILEFLSLDNFNSLNAYDLMKTVNVKHVVDFEDFGYIYFDDKDYENDTICGDEIIATLPVDEEEAIINKKYRKLFDDETLKDPYKVFENRIAIFNNNDALSYEQYEDQLNRVANNCEQTDNENLNKIINVMMKQAYVNIVRKLYIPNKFITRALSKLFKSKIFIEAIKREFAPINYIFSPYCCDINGIHRKDMRAKYLGIQKIADDKGEDTIKTRYAIFRKTLFNEIIDETDSLNKKNNAWTALVDYDASDNFWLSIHAKFLLIDEKDTQANVSKRGNTSKKQTPPKKTEKKQAKKPVKKQESDSDSDEEEPPKKTKSKKPVKKYDSDSDSDDSDEEPKITCKKLIESDSDDSDSD